MIPRITFANSVVMATREKLLKRVTSGYLTSYQQSELIDR
uniref:Uncharacterized protein n=1 Tax=Gloeothece verrucosa (strain PCC 7822) TaxID=497965 RepID=E0UD86_GLOV7|nr:hypothetical protein Cyan7822_0954 [Gloeothece verrucosa PCC 7822]